jgi:hypothetical protein
MAHPARASRGGDDVLGPSLSHTNAHATESSAAFEPDLPGRRAVLTRACLPDNHARSAPARAVVRIAVISTAIVATPVRSVAVTVTVIPAITVVGAAAGRRVVRPRVGIVPAADISGSAMLDDGNCPASGQQHSGAPNTQE